MRIARSRPLAALFGLALVIACGPSDVRTSFSSTAFTEIATPLYVPQMRPYTGARLFSENNQDYRFRALGCEYDVQYRLGLSPEDQTVQSAYRNLQAEAQRSGNVTLEFVARLINGRMTAGDPAGRMMGCDTSFNPVAFVLARYRTAEGTAPAALVWSSRDDITYVFLMKSDFLTPEQEQTALKAAGEFGFELLKAWARRR